MTRRDFISAAAMATAGTMLASPTRSNVGGKHIRQIRSVAPIDYSALDYVQDGLVAQFDGIENVEYGVHGEDVVEWKSLTSNYVLDVASANCMTSGFEVAAALVVYSSRYLTDASCMGFLLNPISESSNTFVIPECTMELVLKPYQYASNLSMTNITVCNADYNNGISIMSPWSSPRIGFIPSYGSWTQYGKYTLLSDITNKTTTIAGVVAPSDNTQVRTEYFNGQRTGNEYYNTFSMDSRYSFAIVLMPGMTYAIRLYNRALTDAEVLYNAQIDQARFGK